MINNFNSVASLAKSVETKLEDTSATISSAGSAHHVPDGLIGSAPAKGGDSLRPRGAELSLLDASSREIAAAEIYREQTLYHVTTKAGKASLQRRGFNVQAKSGGATEELTRKVSMSSAFEANTKTHHYAFLDKKSAEEFQRGNLKESGETALTRLFKGDAQIERDPDFSNPAAVRWRTDLPSSHVLKSAQTSASMGESQMMQKALEARGVNVTEIEAGRLLRAVQSDSEDDFAPDQSVTKSKWKTIREDAPDMSREKLLRRLNEQN